MKQQRLSLQLQRPTICNVASCNVATATTRRRQRQLKFESSKFQTALRPPSMASLTHCHPLTHLSTHSVVILSFCGQGVQNRPLASTHSCPLILSTHLVHSSCPLILSTHLVHSSCVVVWTRCPDSSTQMLKWAFLYVDSVSVLHGCYRQHTARQCLAKVHAVQLSGCVTLIDVFYSHFLSTLKELCNFVCLVSSVDIDKTSFNALVWVLHRHCLCGEWRP